MLPRSPRRRRRWQCLGNGAQSTTRPQYAVIPSNLDRGTGVVTSPRKPVNPQQHQKCTARHDHDCTQQLAHAERAQNEAELCVRLTRELDEEANHPVADKKERRVESGTIDAATSGKAV